MTLTGIHFILFIFLGLDLIQTKHLLIESENGAGTDYGHDDIVDSSDQDFGEFDLDGNGMITMRELRDYWRGWWSEKEIKESFKNGDKNGDGVLDLTEMKELWKQWIKQKFDDWDGNGDGKITLWEYKEYHMEDHVIEDEEHEHEEEEHEKELQESFQLEDLNGDGVIDFTEMNIVAEIY